MIIMAEDKNNSARKLVSLRLDLTIRLDRMKKNGESYDAVIRRLLGE